MIVAYALACAATQLLWLTYAAITTESAHRYGVSVDAIGWLAEIFPLLYVVLAIPAGIVLDRFFRPALAAGAALMALGGLVRLGGQTFAWAMAGQTLVAVSQPVVLSAVSKLAGEYLPAGQRADGISLGSAGNFVGMLLALLLGPTLGAHGQLERLLVVEAGMGVAAAAALAVVLRRPGLHASAGTTEWEGSAARALWRLEPMRIQCGLVFLGFGIFVALATWLQTLLQPSHVSETTAGVLLVGMVVAGIAGCAALPPLVARRHAERAFMRTAVLVGCAGCAALGAPWLGTRALALVAIGVVLLPALPVILASAERLAGPAAGTAGAIVWLAGNLGGLAVALLVQVLVHHPLPAFLTMAAVALLGLPLAARVSFPVAVGVGAGAGETVQPQLLSTRL